MRPYRHPYATSRLLSLRFEAATRDGEEPIPHVGHLPITVEDNAFVSWWQPELLERIRIVCGAPVRVLVNYSNGEPLRVDTGSGWGTTG